MIIRFYLILGCCTFLSGTAPAAERNVWIDADPACGLGKTSDVDDCWAIIAAIRSSRLNVVAVSTVFGNVSLDKATATARSLLESISTLEPARTVPPVYSGATGPIRVGSVIPLAVNELETALTERPMTILALGPLTNIAMLLKKRPELAHRIEAIVAVAGQRPGQVFKVGSTPILHFHDLNVRKDSDAFDTVLRTGVSLHLIPFEVGRQATVTRADLDSLNANGNLDRWIGERSAAWLDFWEGTLGASGFSPFDTLAVAYLAAPQLFSCDAMPAKIIRRRGVFVVRDTLEVAPTITDGNVVTYCWGLSKVMRNSVTNFVSNPDH
jgi:pyrimidine-specific ribonucleoside hydrolase